jgi:hypothetical protein
MVSRIGAMLVVTALWLSVPSRAAAQVWTIEPDRPALGLSVGKASSVDAGEGGAWNATFELPIYPRWRVRADVGRVDWRFGEDMSGRDFPQRTKMTRASATLVQTREPAGSPINMFTGGGVGVYRFPAPADRGFSRFGVHGLAGIEVWLPSNRAKIVGEARLDLVPPTSRYGLAISPLQISGVLGVRWSWRR